MRLRNLFASAFAPSLGAMLTVAAAILCLGWFCPFAAIIVGCLYVAWFLVISLYGGRAIANVVMVAFGFFAFGFFVLASHAWAATATTTPIVIPWGDLLDQFLLQMSPVIVGLFGIGVAWVCSKLPAQLVTALKAAHADTLVNRAVNQGIALAEGAVKGKTVSVTIANAIMQQAAELLLQNAPWLVKELGTRLGTVLAGKLADLNMLGDDAHGGSLKNPVLPVGPAVPATLTPKST